MRHRRLKGYTFVLQYLLGRRGRGGGGVGGTLSDYNYTVHNNYKIENGVNICTGIKCFNCLK